MDTQYNSKFFLGDKFQGRLCSEWCLVKSLKEDVGMCRDSQTAKHEDEKLDDAEVYDTKMFMQKDIVAAQQKLLCCVDTIDVNVSAAAELIFQAHLAAKSAKEFKRLPTRFPPCMDYVDVSFQLCKPTSRYTITKQTN